VSPPGRRGEAGWRLSLVGCSPKNFNSKDLFEFNTSPGTWKRKKGREKKSQKSLAEGVFCFKGPPLGPVPNFLGFVFGLKGEVLCHP
jgi:hypothetical protein